TRCYRDWSSDVCSSDLSKFTNKNRAAFQILLAKLRALASLSSDRMMSVPGAAIDARQNRIASVPYCWFNATGSSPVPLDFDIFSPLPVRTSECKYTVRKGTWPVK